MKMTETIAQDIRYSLRVFVRNPKFSLALILVLALGIGGTTSIYTVVRGVLLQPLPFKDPDRLVVVGGAASPPAGDVIAWWSQGQTFESLCNYRSGGVNFTDGDAPMRVSATVVSANFFSVFGVTPVLGRAPGADDEKPGNNGVAILSDGMWDQHFSRDSGVIGRIIHLNSLPHIVIGVMPGKFNFPGRTDVWVPRSLGEGSLDAGDDDQTNLSPSLKNATVGRLRDGITLKQAHEQLKILFAELIEISARQGLSPGDGVKLTILHDVFVRDFRQSLWLLLVGVGLLMLISCVNASTLMLSRAVERQKEIAMRLCLGASILRVARQLLIESVLISLASGVIGVLLAYWGVDILRAVGPKNIHRLADVRVDNQILLLALCISFLVGIIVSLLPVARSLSVNLMGALKEEGIKSSTGIHQRVRQFLVTIEIMLALMLVIGATLTMKSFFSLMNISPGFEPNGVMALNVALPLSKYKTSAGLKEAGQISLGEGVKRLSAKQYNAFRVTDFHHKLLEKIGKVPGVISVGGANQTPLSGSRNRVLWADVPGRKGGEALFVHTIGNYFQALGIPVLRGRSFTMNDAENSPKVAVINETFAKKYWGDDNPIGNHVMLDGESQPREVVGVVGDVMQTSLVKDTRPQIYLPYFQPYLLRFPPLDTTFFIRVGVDPKVVISPIREQVAAIDPALPIFRIRDMVDVVSESIADYRFRGLLLGIFASLALIMALTGVYGVVAYSVASRTHEIGVRMALGATPRKVLFMILREGTWLAFIGIGIGIAAAAGLNRFIAGLLYGVSPADPVIVIGSSLLIFAGALSACTFPALSASRIEPSVALRYQ